MGKSLVQTPVNKINFEFVDRATQIVDLIAAHIDANCPHCLELLRLSKSGLRDPNPTDEDTDPVTKRIRYDKSR